MKWAPKAELFLREKGIRSRSRWLVVIMMMAMVVPMPMVVIVVVIVVLMVTVIVDVTVLVTVLTPVHEIQTCGRLVVAKKGSVIASRVRALGGVFVLGHLEANVSSGGPVHIAAGARWRGDCRAPSVTIEPGARIESGCFAVPAELEFNGPRR